MFEEDWNFLKKNFQDAVKKVNKDTAAIKILERKIAHSHRVLQNGQLIIRRNIPTISSEHKTLAETTLLFHDIGRFQEVVLSHQNQAMGEWGKRYDHGHIGAEILSQTPKYNHPAIILPVRHHGHMIEDFYNDAEYQKLPIEQKTAAETAIKIVRDADKLDLYYLHKKENILEHDVFFTNLSDELKLSPPSKIVVEQFLSRKSINHSTIRSMSDRILGCLSWQFDFNYPITAQMYIEKGYQAHLLALFYRYCPDKNFINILKKFIQQI